MIGKSGNRQRPKNNEGRIEDDEPHRYEEKQLENRED